MQDERIGKLAKNLLNYSIKLNKGENILIQIIGEEGLPLGQELIKQAEEMGAYPYFNIINYNILKEMLTNASEEQIKMYAKHDLERMKDMDAYIGISSPSKKSNLNGVPAEKMNMYIELYENPVHIEERVKRTKWCILRAPTDLMASNNKMTMSEYEDFYFNVCTLDYEKMSKAMDNLVDLMNKTKNVHIIGNGTDLSFSIEGMIAEKYTGTFNVPDGEVATAPVIDSANGYITYNTKNTYNGIVFDNIKLEFKDGKIINATAGDKTEELNKLLDIDEGARYIGEFAFGLNPYIDKPVGDILFDEKIKGSFHFTPGDALTMCDNGNRSSIHWDIVCIQTPEHGGGEIYFDNVLIRKDGLFVLDELKALNPENLK